MSFLSDVAALAKAGYSPSDVKELMELNKQTESPKTEATQPAPASNVETEAKTETETVPESSAENAPKESAQPADETDYKSLYEAEKAKVNDLQNKNTKADISQNNNEVNEKDLIDLVKSFC